MDGVQCVHRPPTTFTTNIFRCHSIVAPTGLVPIVQTLCALCLWLTIATARIAGLCDGRFGWMGVGLSGRTTDAAEEIPVEKRFSGRQWCLGPPQVNLGRASSLVAAAAATMETACREIDARIELKSSTDADYLRQVGLATSALDQPRRNDRIAVNPRR